MKLCKFVLLPLLLVLTISTFWMGCTNKGVDQMPGESNIALSFSVQSPSLLAAVEQFTLTVFAPDMDTIVVPLDLIDGRYLVGEVEVPVGPNRTFILQGLSIDNEGVTTVIYTGIQVMNILPGTVNSVEVVLQPMVPMVRITPNRINGESGEPFSLDISVHNIPTLRTLVVQLDYDYMDIWPILVQKPELLPQQVVLSSRGINDGTAFEITVDGSDAGVAITNAAGNAVVAHMEFGTYGRVGPVPVLEDIAMSITLAHGPLGIPIPTGSIFVDHGDALLTVAPDQIVVFPDAALESEIRFRSGVEAGDIMLSDVINITYISAVESSIDTLDGIQHLRNLDFLTLGWSSGPVDLSPLSGLNKLSWFEFQGMEQVDISPLATLTSLIHLDMYWNEIQDISPLAGLVRLNNLDLNSNQISNISALSGLLNLTTLDLNNNQLTTLQPLVDNIGINAGDSIDVARNTGLQNTTVQAQVETLRARGVTVVWDGLGVGSPQ